MAKKKGSNAFWYVLIGILVLIGLWVFIGGGVSAVEIDYTQYQYTDDTIEKPDAEHTLVEYGDFQCPACGQRYPVIKQVKENFDVNVVYKHFPLTSIHPYAQRAAEAAECARDQNKFWAYHDLLYGEQLYAQPSYLAEGYLKQYAEGLGLDTAQFNQCIDERLKQTVVAADVLEGQQAGVDSTPTLILDGQEVGYYQYSQFAQALQ